MDDRTAESTIESRISAESRFYNKTENMPLELKQAWEGARLALGVVRATMLLEDTYRYYNPNAQENI